MSVEMGTVRSRFYTRVHVEGVTSHTPHLVPMKCEERYKTPGSCPGSYKILGLLTNDLSTYLGRKPASHSLGTICVLFYNKLLLRFLSPVTFVSTDPTLFSSYCSFFSPFWGKVHLS